MDDSTREPGPEGAPAAAPTPADSPGGPRSRRPLLVGLAVLVVAAVVAAVVLGLGGRGGGRVAEPGTVVLPSPTPTVAPVARQPLTPFADSLPGSVLQYALASLAEHPPLLLAGALEAYRLDYSDGATGTVTVTAGQWPTPEEAGAALPALVAAAGTPPADAEGPTSGEVLVGGAVAGTWTLTQAADGTGVMTWSNGTVVLQAVAPTADVARDVYAAYPY